MQTNIKKLMANKRHHGGVLEASRGIMEASWRSKEPNKTPPASDRDLDVDPPALPYRLRL